MQVILRMEVTGEYLEGAQKDIEKLQEDPA